MALLASRVGRAGAAGFLIASVDSARCGWLPVPVEAEGEAEEAAAVAPEADGTGSGGDTYTTIFQSVIDLTIQFNKN